MRRESEIDNLESIFPGLYAASRGASARGNTGRRQQQTWRLNFASSVENKEEHVMAFLKTP